MTKNNFQLVAENAGQFPEVLMSNYNEALDSEKRDMAKMVEESFYPKALEKSQDQHQKKARDVLADLESMMASDPAISRESCSYCSPIQIKSVDAHITL